MNGKYERDIVCGMYLLTIDGCKVSEFNGQKYYFCCDTCKDEFDKHTDKYVDDIAIKNKEIIISNDIE